MKNQVSYPEFFALLRGINVGGKNKLPMADLRACLENIGLSNPRTYIQSGNILFQSQETNKEKLIAQIQASILKEFNIESSVFLEDKAFLVSTLENNPYLKATPDMDIKELHVTFLSESSTELELVSPERYLPDSYKLIEGRAYVHCPNGYGRTKLNNSFFEKNAKVSCTTRNWKTCQKILSLFDT